MLVGQQKIATKLCDQKLYGPKLYKLCEFIPFLESFNVQPFKHIHNLHWWSARIQAAPKYRAFIWEERLFLHALIFCESTYGICIAIWNHKYYSQIEHCYALLWCVLIQLPAVMLCTDIGNKNTSSLHALTFCETSLLPLSMLYKHIGHKNTSHLHGLTSCENSHLPLLMLSNHIGHKNTSHLHALTVCEHSKSFCVMLYNYSGHNYT